MNPRSINNSRYKLISRYRITNSFTPYNKLDLISHCETVKALPWSLKKGMVLERPRRYETEALYAFIMSEIFTKKKKLFSKRKSYLSNTLSWQTFFKVTHPFFFAWANSRENFRQSQQPGLGWRFSRPEHFPILSTLSSPHRVFLPLRSEGEDIFRRHHHCEQTTTEGRVFVFPTTRTGTGVTAAGVRMGTTNIVWVHTTQDGVDRRIRSGKILAPPLWSNTEVVDESQHNYKKILCCRTSTCSRFFRLPGTDGRTRGLTESFRMPQYLTRTVLLGVPDETSAEYYQSLKFSPHNGNLYNTMRNLLFRIEWQWILWISWQSI